MSKPNYETPIRNWMHMHCRDGNCTDSITGEINCTELAEQAADHFDLYEDRIDYRPIESLFALLLTGIIISCSFAFWLVPTTAVAVVAIGVLV